MKESSLESISLSIFTGVPVGRYRKTDAVDSGYKVLMGNALDELGEVLPESLENIEIIDDTKLDRMLLNAGDVAVLARGTAIRAGIISQEIAQLTVIPSASFVIIRPDREKLLGEVLVAYLNSVVGQSIIATSTNGATIQNSVSASDLKKMMITLPNMLKQQEIVDLFYASNQAYRNGIAFIEQQRITASACMLSIMSGENHEKY